MKVYVWEDVLVDYSPGLMVATGDTIKQARAALRKIVGNESEIDRKPTHVWKTGAHAAFVYGGG